MFIICDECGEKIDITAKACTNCGCPMRKEKNYIVEWIIFVITLILALVYFCSLKIIAATILAISAILINPEFIEKNNSNRNKSSAIYIIIWFVLVIFAIFFLSEKYDTSLVDDVNKEVNAGSSIHSVEEKNEFISSCSSYDYKEIARNPSNYRNKHVMFIGEVIQVMEGLFDEVTFRISVTENEFGYYEDIIYATYTYSDGESKILENDIVTLYGICEGDYTYTSVLGQSITVPKVSIRYIELGDKASGETLATKITLEKFNQIQTGMTYSEVVSIIGEDGELTSDIDLNMGSQYITKNYEWKGKTGTASITFQGGKVNMKYQYGLK